MPDFLFEQHNGIATISLNRPDKRNAFNATLIADLTACYQRIATDNTVRVLILTGVGTHFCAGADLDWMRDARTQDHAGNLADAEALGEMLFALHTLPQITIAAVNGPAFGGGVGLALACDITLASVNAQFCLSEVKLGLVPAVISPYLIAAIGARHAKRVSLTAEIITALDAERMGLVSELTPPDALLHAATTLAETIANNAPQALTITKLLFTPAFTASDRTKLAEIIARVRVSEEGRAGIDAFLSKQSAPWIQKKDRHD